jgi:hypothetical protein
MWSFITSIPNTTIAGFKPRYTVLKDLCEDLIKLENNSSMKLKGHIVMSSITDKNVVPLPCEKYVVENDLYILFGSANNLLDLCSNESSNAKISKISLSRMGWFTK